MKKLKKIPKDYTCYKNYIYFNRGFTLIEIMVALAILSLAITSLLIARNNCINIATKTKELRQIKMLLDYQLGKILLGLEKRESGVFEIEGYKNYIWYVQIKEVEIYPIKNRVFSNNNTKVKQKKITLYIYNKAEKDKVYKIETFQNIEK